MIWFAISCSKHIHTVSRDTKNSIHAEKNKKYYI